MRKCFSSAATLTGAAVAVLLTGGAVGGWSASHPDAHPSAGNWVAANRLPAFDLGVSVRGFIGRYGPAVPPSP